MYFSNKSILLVSPQNWSHIPVSKHHYANALVNAGATVYFLEPPRYSKPFKVSLEESPRGVRILHWSIPIPNWMKFKITWLFYRLMNRYLDKIILYIDQIDVVWNFDNGNYFNIRPYLRDAYKIFHPVDKINKRVKTFEYDLVLSVSEKILNSVLHSKKVLIPHGLRPGFLNQMNDAPLRKALHTENKVGYVGNIGHPSFELDWFVKLTNVMEEVDFHLWGTLDDSNTELSRLLDRVNVKHHGVIRGDELFLEMKNMNALILLYKESPLFAMDNSHKVIEYLSTGLPVVSTPLSFYKGSDLFFQEDDFSSFSRRLSQVLSAGYKHESSRGMNYARQNSYDEHLKRISECIEG